MPGREIHSAEASSDLITNERPLKSIRFDIADVLEVFEEVRRKRG